MCWLGALTWSNADGPAPPFARWHPVHGVKRPKIETNEGKTPALGDNQTELFLGTPDDQTLKGLRERALLAVVLYHGLRREEEMSDDWRFDGTPRNKASSGQSIVPEQIGNNPLDTALEGNGGISLQTSRAFHRGL
jgi:hypothetical protein